jgi:short-subunit dehydrogenase
MELAPFGIHVVTVQPGTIKSQFGETAEKISSDILRPGSWYASMKEVIKMRAQISQADSTSAGYFAEKLVSRLMLKKPPSIIRIGKKSFLVPVLNKILPIDILDRILVKKFKLDQLK